MRQPCDRSEATSLRKVDKKIGDKHLVISVCLLHDYELL